MKKILIVASGIIVAVGIIVGIVAILNKNNCTCIEKAKSFFDNKFTCKIITKTEA